MPLIKNLQFLLVSCLLTAYRKSVLFSFAKNIFFMSVVGCPIKLTLILVVTSNSWTCIFRVSLQSYQMLLSNPDITSSSLPSIASFHGVNGSPASTTYCQPVNGLDMGPSGGSQTGDALGKALASVSFFLPPNFKWHRF